jgi:hypothetical protein
MSLSGDGVAVMTAVHHRDCALARDLVYECDAAELAMWLAHSFVRWIEDTAEGRSVPALLQENGLRFAQQERAA